MGVPRLAPERCEVKAKINSDYTWHKLILFESRIHGRGVKAGEHIPAGRPVIEHTGRLLNRKQFKEYDRIEREHVYVWTINAYWSMDGSDGGSGAEFVNHSCDPNLTVRFTGKRIYYYSRRAIRRGEELTIDYNFDPDANPVPCRCGSKMCRGTINSFRRVRHGR